MIFDDDNYVAIGEGSREADVVVVLTMPIIKMIMTVGR